MHQPDPPKPWKNSCSKGLFRLLLLPFPKNTFHDCSVALNKRTSGIAILKVVRIISILALLLFSQASIAQHNRDSLKAVAESDMHDSLRIEAILLITDDLYDEEELKYFALGRKIAERNLKTSGDNERTRMTYLEALDKLCTDEAWAQSALFSNAERALEYSLKCLNKWHSNPNNSLMGQALNNISVQHYYLGSIDSAMHYQSRALDMRRLLPDKEGYAQSLISMGYISFRGGLIGPSIPYFLEAIDILEEANDMKGLQYALRMLGTVYAEIDEYEMLLELAQRRLALALQYDSYAEIASAYNGIAVSWNGLQRYDSAAYYYEKCVSIIPLLEKGQQSKGFMWLTNYATFLQANGNPEKALTTINQAAQLAGATDNFEEKARLSDVKSLIFNDLLMSDSAIFYGNLLMGEAERTGRWDLLAAAGERLQKAYFAKKNFAQAYHYLSIARQFSDSLLNKENTRQTERAELMYKFSKQEAESRAQQAQLDAIAAAELRHQRNLKNIGFIIGSLILLLAFGLYRRYRFKQRVADELEAKNAEIEAARERAERSEDFRKQFLANMSHEIRTPMNAILGMTRLLKDRDHDPQSRLYLDAVDHAANNLLVVINDILDLSKLEAGKMEARFYPTPLKDELNLLGITFAQRAAEKGLRFDLQLNESLPDYVHTDMARIVQVLYNLLGNAIKFTDTGGVSLVVHSSPANGARTMLTFAVKDTGPGIAAEDQARIFESFGQGHAQDNRRYSGTGLGLTIARSLVEILGGKLQVESAPGEGATFSFSITCALSTREAFEAYSKEITFIISNEHKNYPLRVLLADDNDYNRLVAKDTLLKYMPKIHIAMAESGQQVIDMLVKADYDVVLMDVQMPGMDGYDATKAIRSHSIERIQNVHIVAFTASVIRTDIQRCYDAGMNGYIAKPFRDEDLLKPLVEWIDKTNGNATVDENPDYPIQSETDVESTKSESRVDAKTTLFMQLVPQRLAKLKTAITENDAATTKSVIHLMKPQLLDFGMDDIENELQWFEYLDVNSPSTAWVSKAKQVADLLHLELELVQKRTSNE